MANTERRSKHGAPRDLDTTLNVLCCREENEWVALAMEMDLRGYGGTFHEALKELAELVRTQVDFAQFKNQPDLIWKPAEPAWWGRFAEARRAARSAAVP